MTPDGATLTASDERMHTACLAVAHALRPGPFRAIARQATWPTPDKHADVAHIIETRMREKSDLARTGPWWAASGPTMTAALMSVRELEEDLASYLIGAALQATITAGADLVSDSILRLAESAASWIDGRNHAGGAHA
jgi:hypothetical protein